MSIPNQTQVLFDLSTTDDKSGPALTVSTNFFGIVNRAHHEAILRAMAVNCIKQLGLLTGMEQALQEVTEGVYKSSFKSLPSIKYLDEE